MATNIFDVNTKTEMTYSNSSTFNVSAVEEYPDPPYDDKEGGWIGVDLDGTLAKDPQGKQFDINVIGDPVEAMVARVKKWLGLGIDVRIFTARVDGGDIGVAAGLPGAEGYRDVEAVTKIIQDWTEKHIGIRLPVTNKKDCMLMQYWDDKAVGVVIDTGKVYRPGN